VIAIVGQGAGCDGLPRKWQASREPVTVDFIE
jgi:hypothetical protein